MISKNADLTKNNKYLAIRHINDSDIARFGKILALVVGKIHRVQIVLSGLFIPR